MQKLSASDKKILEVLQTSLTELGWEVLRNDLSGILRKKSFILFLYQDESDLARPAASSFVYDQGACKSGQVIDAGGLYPINYRMHHVLVGYNWWIECNGALVAFGKIKKMFAGMADNSASEKTQRQYKEFVQMIDSLATGGKDAALIRRPQYCKQTSIQVQHELRQYTGETVKENLYIWTKDNLYLMIKKMEQASNAAEVMYMLVPVRVDKEENNFTTEVVTNTKPMVMMEKELQQFISNAGFKIYTEFENPVEVSSMRWAESDNQQMAMLSPEDSELYKEFALSGLQRQILAIGLQRVYNVTPLLNKKINATTGSFILKFMESFLDASLVTENYGEEILQTLFNIAKNGISLKKYAVAGYTSSRIQALYNEFLTGFQRQEEQLRNAGCSVDQINFIRYIASKGGGIAHVKTGEPLHVLWLRDEIARGNLVELMTWMIPYAQDETTANIRVPWNILPSSLQDYVITHFKSVPEFSFQGRSWKEIVDYACNNATGINYNYTSGLMIEFNRCYLAMDVNSVMLKTPSLSNAANAMYINGKMYVNDRNMDRLPFAL